MHLYLQHATLVVDYSGTLGQNHLKAVKVEKILKGSLNSIPSPSPSLKIQIMGGEKLIEV